MAELLPPASWPILACGNPLDAQRQITISSRRNQGPPQGCRSFRCKGAHGSPQTHSLHNDFTAVIFVLSLDTASGQRRRDAHTSYAMESVAIDYYDDGRVVEAYREKRYVLENGNWLAVRTIPGGYVNETVGLVGKGIFTVDKRAKKLWFRASYNKESMSSDLPERPHRSKPAKVNGHDILVLRVRRRNGIALVGRSPALNGDLIQSIERNSGFSRVIEPVKISFQKQPSRLNLYEDYEIAFGDAKSQ